MEALLLGNRYRATEKIGTGGMADVYKAIDSTLGRTVAVKVMHARFAADPEFATRFRREAQAAANLASPNIVTIYDWGQDADTYYIAMEYVRGSDLKSMIRRNGAMSSRKVAEIGAQVCSALTAAHGYDIIHRDIKPHNIMVQPDGSVKVMDFGIARAGNTTLTQTGSVLGTAQYMSPEQAQGKELHPTSDLYSLGIVLYEAATGRIPFDADTPVAVALKQVSERAVAPHIANPKIDPGLDAVIVKAMQKEPADRYASADDLRRDLLAVAQGSALEAAAGFTGMGGDAGVPSVAATSVMPRVNGAVRPRAKRSSDAGRTKTAAAAGHRRVWPWMAAAALLVAAGLGVAWSAGRLGSPSAAATPVVSASHSVEASRSVAVPDVRSLTRARAQKALESAGLTIGTVKQVSSDSVKKGAVARQSPLPAETAQQGSAVNLVLSKGPETIPVPNVVGMPEADAFAAIQSAGFSPQELPSQFNTDAPANAVYTQTPASASKVVKGSIVTYVVSRGPEPVAVPDAGLQDGKLDKKKGHGRWW